MSVMLVLTVQSSSTKMRYFASCIKT